MNHNRWLYLKGCRCELCRTDNREYDAARRKEMKSRRSTCSHYKWRTQSAAREMCCLCGKSRKKAAVMGAAA